MGLSGQSRSIWCFFFLILGAAFLFTLFWVLVLPLFTLERKSLWEAVQESAAHVRAQLPWLAGVLLRWNLSALIRSVLVFSELPCWFTAWRR